MEGKIPAPFSEVIFEKNSTAQDVLKKSGAMIKFRAEGNEQPFPGNTFQKINLFQKAFPVKKPVAVFFARKEVTYHEEHILFLDGVPDPGRNLDVHFAFCF